MIVDNLTAKCNEWYILINTIYFPIWYWFPQHELIPIFKLKARIICKY